MTELFFVLVAGWLLMGIKGGVLLALAGLALLGTFFFLAATGRTRLCRHLALSLGVGAAAMLAVAVLGTALWPLIQGTVRTLGLTSPSDLESAGWMTALTIWACSNLAGLGAFMVHFANVLRRPRTPVACAPVVNRDWHLSLRVAAAVGGALCVAAGGYAVYFITPDFHSSQSLVQRLMETTNQQLITGAQTELIGRGAASVPVIVAALEAAPERDKRTQGWDQPHQSLRHPLQVLGEINTPETREFLRSWAGRREYSPVNRIRAFQALARHGDCSDIVLLDDLLRDKANGRFRELVLSLISGKGAEASAAFPYIRMAVEDSVLAEEPTSWDLGSACMIALKDMDNPEARELLVRIAQHDRAYRAMMEDLYGKEYVRVLLKRSQGSRTSVQPQGSEGGT